jgi:hypothetical protein
MVTELKSLEKLLLTLTSERDMYKSALERAGRAHQKVLLERDKLWEENHALQSEIAALRERVRRAG